MNISKREETQNINDAGKKLKGGEATEVAAPRTEERVTKHRQCLREMDWEIRSNRSLIYVCTHEEGRVLDTIKEVCLMESRNWNLLVWDLAEGLQAKTPFDTKLFPDNTALDQVGILEWFNSLEVPASKATPGAKPPFTLLVLKDYHKFMGSQGGSGQVEHMVNRCLRNMGQSFVSEPKAILMMGTHLYLPDELSKITAVIDWPLPEREHIKAKVEGMLETASQMPELRQRGFKLDYTTDENDQLIRALQGLSITEVELQVTKAMVKGKTLDPIEIATNKKDIIRKSGILEWVDSEQSLDKVGGLRELKRWLTKRSKAFSQQAIDYGLPANPKGVLLVGVQGAGKSLSAQAIAQYWNLPLLRLDMGKIFHGIVGSSEENVRSAIALAESISPCLLWCDEIDKGMSGVGSSNQTDGGTASRVFGTLLTWMQSKKAPVYFVATANDVTQLPPELLRKGRFDEIFFVDLPDVLDRQEIFRIHLNKTRRPVESFDIGLLASDEVSDQRTGSEIESAIEDAMYEAFNDNERAVTTQDIVVALSSSVPLAETMKENIDKLREWARHRARDASRPPAALEKMRNKAGGTVAPSILDQLAEPRGDDEL